MSRLYFDTEEDLDLDTTSEHQEDDEEEAAIRKRLAEQAILDEATGAILKPRELQRLGLEICSCGCFTCPLRKIYGHPVPTFEAEIKPLAPQPKRDRRALELKGCSKLLGRARS